MVSWLFRRFKKKMLPLFFQIRCCCRFFSHSAKQRPRRTTTTRCRVGALGSVDDLINEVEKARADTVTLPLSYTYVDLERSTDKDSACELEKQCQDYCNAIRLSNHTEDEAYHKGSSSKKTPHAGACAGLVVDSLRAVQQGLLFFNSSMQPVLTAVSTHVKSKKHKTSHRQKWAK
mmetsp:Transcript_29893/g.87288  ORF Transcript_29893/g.87288 Transcript_29893/m.87288 type:complete len:175 (+) Transcript_29893:2078-2602(+)